MGYSNYYDMFRQVDQPMFYDPRQSQPLGAYLPKSTKATPMALGAFLPMRLPRASPQGSQNFDISPKSRRSGKSQRPYSADVNQLCALEEDSRSNASFKKG